MAIVFRSDLSGTDHPLESMVLNEYLAVFFLGDDETRFSLAGSLRQKAIKLKEMSSGIESISSE